MLYKNAKYNNKQLFIQIDELLSAGYSISKTGKTIGISSETIIKCITHFGKQPSDYNLHLSKKSPFTKEELVLLYEKYNSTKTVSEQTNVSYNMVSYYRDKWKIKINPKNPTKIKELNFETKDNLHDDILAMNSRGMPLQSISENTFYSIGYVRYYLLKWKQIKSNYPVNLWNCAEHDEKYMAVYEQQGRTRCYCVGCTGIDSSKKLKQSNKIKAIEYKGGECQECGYSETVFGLEFHHIDETKDKNISQLLGCSWETLKKELEKCILLCVVCHRKKHNKRLSIKRCSLHEKNNYKNCVQCRNDYVYAKRNLLKQCLIDSFDRKCQLCNEAKEDIAFDFHHINPMLKTHKVSETISSLKHKTLLEEINNLTMLCVFCHQRVERSKVVFKFKHGSRSVFNEHLKHSGFIKSKKIEMVRKTKISWPPIEFILQELELKSYTQLAKELSTQDISITDNAIRSHIRKTGMAPPKKQKSLSNKLLDKDF